MLKCFTDGTVSKNSPCTYCCLYCNKKDGCEYRCAGVDKWKTETNIEKHCINCY